MRSTGRLVLVLWGMMVVALVSGQAGEAAPAGLAAYFPLAQGTTWLYRTNTSGEITIRVNGVQRVGEFECRMIETVVDGNITQAECYRVASDGVYAHQRSYPAGSVVLVPPQRVLAAPVAVGRKWQWVGKISEHEVVFNYTWARRESAKTPAGTFDAMQLYFTGVVGPGVSVESWRWFAPGVGMVKEDTTLVQAGRTLRIYAELVRMTPGR
ncbi:MAG: hypothetical protein ACT4P5_14760 [Armatimonadota bacterium]